MLRRLLNLLLLSCLASLLIPIPAVNAASGWQAHSIPGTGTLNLLDAAISPNYEQDKTLYILGWDNGFRLWRGQNGTWTEVLRLNGGNDSLDKVMLAPGGLLLCGLNAGVPAIWHSANNGTTFTIRNAPYAIDQWVCATDGTLFIGGYDGTHTLLSRTADYGTSYASPVIAADEPLYSIAVSPAYAQDGIILAGTSNGKLWRSQDRGASFQEIPSLLTGNISLAFDPDYASNQRVYVASDAAGGGLYSLNLNTNEWLRLDSGLPAGAMLGSLVAAPSGLLYAANYQSVNTAALKGGMLRCIAGAAATCEVVLAGLPEGTTLWRVWRSGTRLWAMDTTQNRLFYFDDDLGRPVSLKSPAEGALRLGLPSGGKINGITLEWEALADLSVAGFHK
jgi:WD40 repeat protein